MHTEDASVEDQRNMLEASDITLDTQGRCSSGPLLYANGSYAKA